MKYEAKLEREVDYTQISIASSELCSILYLIEHSRNDEVEFYKYVAYAKELQKGILEMELELKKRLGKITKEDVDKMPVISSIQAMQKAMDIPISPFLILNNKGAKELDDKQKELIEKCNKYVKDNF
jgi:hypothetical protein